MSRALGAAGFVEVINYPFVNPSVHDDFGLAADDPRRQALRLANPISDAEPELRTSLLPGLLTNLVRNVGRGSRDVALFELGLVFQGGPAQPLAPRPGVDRRPTAEQLAAIEATVPAQPRHAATVLAGELEQPGWWGAGRQAGWADAIESARSIARAARVDLGSGRPTGRRGIRAGARSCCWPAGRWALPVSCIPGWCRRSACPPAAVRWS